MTDQTTIQNAINWFEIPVSDLDRAVKFYESVFEVSLHRDTMDVIELAVFPFQEGTVSGALIKCDFLQPSATGSLVYFNVNNKLDQTLVLAKENNAEIFLPKTDIGKNGIIAHIGDTEGNKIALHSF